MEGENTGVFVEAGQLSPDFVSHPSMSTFIKEGKVDIGNVVKSYIGAQDLIGRKGIPAPKDENDAEGYARVYDALGRPKTPDEYKLPEFSEFKAPEGFKVSDELTKAYRTWAHEEGLSPKQTASLYKKFIGSQIAEYTNLSQAIEKNRTDSEKALRAQWGKAYDQNVALAKKVIQGNADKDAIQALEEGAGNDPRLIRMLANLGMKMSEGGLIGKHSNLTLSPEEAQAEINKINADRTHPYWVATHLEHAAAVKKFADLMAMASPQQ